MSPAPQQVRAFLDAADVAVLVEVTRTQGSTPREAGTWMVVTATGLLGTIGGGQLEFRAIDRARAMIKEGMPADVIDLPLGPEIGQCCGGRVEISLQTIDAPIAQDLRARAEADYALRPHVYVFGAGHVGKALARALTPLPYRTLLVDNRAVEIQGAPVGVEARHVPVQEALVREAPEGSAFVILTHDHGLDFLIAREALERNTAYVGMIGSKTKRATFKSWLADMGVAPGLAEGLVMPIGGSDVNDKRPEVIAALTAAEVVRAIARYHGGGDG
ncbi:xanthine dehydrogenase accessory protein XdhC [Pelagibacterium xiamenense]|uniref:xanthine dehydrogenase accessory protein XdhC n=1 Tax=Pelagibacterium xiamenense TaxID=2901140 RepID=UPI001E5A862A|nr:xanthine dehydrogenase accessory protein XdhC [Pelagibacterium xiamenense]MCD7060360.1 xanthine dehydrogenase accessory protein XdhC [Pelagibacterium xiamenense]